MKNVASKVYFGTPRLVGQIFRATKTPSIILLVWFIGVPIIWSLVLTVSAIEFHSMLPLTLFLAGVFDYAKEANPLTMPTSPTVAKVLQAMSPSQIQLGRHMFELFIVGTFIAVFAFFWWLVKFMQFLAARPANKV